MERVRENQLVLPALYLLNSLVQGLKTSDLKASLMLFFPPTGEDAEILAGRADTKLSQKIRNLTAKRKSRGLAPELDSLQWLGLPL